MALRTPPLQLRSQYNPYWGAFANSFTALPNQSGNILAAAQFVLEEGDVAYSNEDDRLCVCVSPGTAGGGDAEWILVDGGTSAFANRAIVVAGANVTTQTGIGVNISGSPGGIAARAFTPASAVYLERQLRVAFASAIAANAAAGQRLAQLQWALVNPTEFVCRVGLSGTAVLTGRFICGLFPQVTQQFFGATEPSTLLNCIFVGCDSGDANLQLMHNDGAGACTKIDLGAAFARAANITVQIRFRISAGQVRYEIRRLDAAGVATGTIVLNLPADTQTLTWSWEAHTDGGGANIAAIENLGLNIRPLS